MWVYSTTTAATAHATRGSSTASSFLSITQSYRAHSSGGSATGAQTLCGTTFRTAVNNAYESAETMLTSASTSGSVSESPGGVVTDSVSDYESIQVLHGFTISTTGATTVSAGVTSTSSAQFTASRSLAGYASTTTTFTSSGLVDTTTTLATTRSIYSTSTNSRTQTTSQAITQTTSTAESVQRTGTSYASAASGSITAPVSLVPISAAGVHEQAWEVTVTTDSAGYASHIGTTFTRRTGDAVLTSTALPVVAASTFTDSTTAYLSIATLMLRTTATTTTIDTFVPSSSSLPATATSTRSFTLVTTVSSTQTALDTSAATVSITGPTSNYVSTVSTVLSLNTATVSFTYNLSPTSTSSTGIHVTWFGTATLTAREMAQQYATSSSRDGFGLTIANTTEDAATTVDTTTTASTDTTAAVVTTLVFGDTTSATTTSTQLEPDAGSVDFTTEAGVFTESGSFSESAMETTAIEGFGHSTTTFQYTTTFTSASTYGATTGSTTIGGGVGSIFSTTYFANTYSESSLYYSAEYSDGLVFITDFSDSFEGSSSDANSGTFSETFDVPLMTVTTTTSASTTVSFTATTTSTSSTTTSTATTASDTTSIDAPFTSETGSFYSEINGISYTRPELHPQLASAASAVWSAHAMHPRNGWRHPLSLAASDAVFLAISVTPMPISAALATQDDESGPLAQKFPVGVTTYSTGASRYSAAHETADGQLHFTVSNTAASTTANGIVSFSGDGVMTWFAPSLTTSAGSVIGGAPAKSENELRAYFIPGVRHWTRQTAGYASSSATSWLQAPDQVTGSSFGIALPERTESVWSVRVPKTAASYSDAGGFLSVLTTGSLYRPAFTLSLHPDI